MLYLIGYMGAGKTTIAKLLANELHLPYYDTDQEIEKKEKRSLSEIFKKDGELHFRILETELLKNINQNSIIACGGGLPIHNNNMGLINSKGISIYLKASDNCLFNRLKKEKQNRPLIANKTDEELEVYINSNLQNRNDFYNLASYTILVDDKSTDEVLREINSLIGSF
ncbi:MAG: shikimate kinase [Flavobacteriales bacterium]|jgi:shikimate kinase|nr:shikimate kinase [Flavobacteriales bacterium]